MSRADDLSRIERALESAGAITAGASLVEEIMRREREGNRVYYSVANPVVEETMRFFSSIAPRVDEFQGGGSARL